MFEQLKSRKGGKRNTKELAAIVGIAVLACVVASIFGFYLTQKTIHLDTLGCPDTGILSNRLIIVDRTGEIPRSAQRAIRTTVEKMIEKAPAGTRFSLFEIDSRYMRGLSSATFSRCKLRDGTQANPYNENPRLIRMNYIKKFQAPFMLALDKILIGSSQPRSPILEALVDLTSVHEYQRDLPTTISIFSDMLQNTDEYSQYGVFTDFTSAVKRPEVNRLIPSLAGAEVELYYLLRNGKELKMQDNNHVQFWLDYFTAAQANVQLVKKIR